MTYLPTVEEERALIDGDRWLWWQWKKGEITYREAAYLLQRGSVIDRLLDLHLPTWFDDIVLWFYDVIYESDAIAEPDAPPEAGAKPGDPLGTS